MNGRIDAARSVGAHPRACRASDATRINSALIASIPCSAFGTRMLTSASARAAARAASSLRRRSSSRRWRFRSVSERRIRVLCNSLVVVSRSLRTWRAASGRSFGSCHGPPGARARSASAVTLHNASCCVRRLAYRFCTRASSLVTTACAFCARTSSPSTCALLELAPALGRLRSIWTLAPMLTSRSAAIEAHRLGEPLRYAAISSRIVLEVRNSRSGGSDVGSAPRMRAAISMPCFTNSFRTAGVKNSRARCTRLFLRAKGCRIFHFARLLRVTNREAEIAFGD